VQLYENYFKRLQFIVFNFKMFLIKIILVFDFNMFLIKIILVVRQDNNKVTKTKQICLLYNDSK